jgi:hypothetical protein
VHSPDDPVVHGLRADFTPGAGTAVVGPAVTVLLDVGPDHELVDLIRDPVLDGAGFDRVASMLASVGFADMPALAVAGVVAGRCRVVLRGGAAATVTTPEGPTDLVAEAVVTWTEHAVEQPTGVRLSVGGEVDRSACCVEVGVVPASAISRRIEHRPDADLPPVGARVVAGPGEWSFGGSAPNGDRATSPDEGGGLATDTEADGALPADGDGVGHAVAGADGALVEVRDDDAGADAVGSGAVADPIDAGLPPVAVGGQVAVAEPDSGSPVEDRDGRQHHAPLDLADEPDRTLIPEATTLVEWNGAEAHDGPVADSDPRGLHGSPGGPTPEDSRPDLSQLPPPFVISEVPHAVADPTDDYDHLFGATEYRSVEDAAVRAPVDDPAGGNGSAGGGTGRSADSDPNHDGMTMTLAELEALQQREVQASSPASPSGAGHLVVRCEHQHLNPPHAAECRVCRGMIHTQAPVMVDGIDLGRLRFSTGQVVRLERPVLIGRSPKASGPVGGSLPELVTVPSPGQDISRTHVEVRVDGWQVFVVDRDSTNGTTVIVPGSAPQRLRAGEPYPLPTGGRVSLADEVEFTFEAVS